MPCAELLEGDLLLKLSLLERLGALRFSDVRVPLASIASVAVSHVPWEERPWRGVRVGTGFPWVILLGRMVTTSSADFVAVYGRRRPTLVLTLKPGCGWRVVVATLRDADAVAKQVVGML
jgi:hypothetical protein